MGLFFSLAACGDVLGLNDDDDPARPDPGDAGNGESAATGTEVDGTNGNADAPTTSGRFCSAKTAAALCADFDDGDAGAIFPVVSEGGAAIRIVDSDASTPHALLIDVPASPTAPASAAMQTAVPRVMNATITIDADLRVDAVNAGNVYTHVLVVSFGADEEPRYEVTLDSARFSLFAYGADGGIEIASSGSVSIPVGTWIHANLVMRIQTGDAVLKLGSASVELRGRGIITTAPSIFTGPNVWVGTGAVRTAVAYDNFVVTLSP